MQSSKSTFSAVYALWWNKKSAIIILTQHQPLQDLLNINLFFSALRILPNIFHIAFTNCSSGKQWKMCFYENHSFKNFASTHLVFGIKNILFLAQKCQTVKKKEKKKIYICWKTNTFFSGVFVALIYLNISGEFDRKRVLKLTKIRLEMSQKLLKQTSRPSKKKKIDGEKMVLLSLNERIILWNILIFLVKFSE